MPLKQFGRILRRNVWIILILTIVGGAIGFGMASTERPVYSATTRVLFAPSLETGSSSDLAATATIVSGRVATYTALVDTPLILDPVIQQLGLNATSSQIAGAVSATQEATNNIVTVNATSSQPQAAAALADAVADSIATQVTDFSIVTGVSVADPTGTTITITSDVVDPATAPTRPSSPDVPLTTFMGAAIGFALALVLAGIRAYADSRVRTRHDIREATAAEIAVEGLAKGSADALISPVGPANTDAEAYRRFVAEVSARPEGIGRSVLVASPRTASTTETAAANLAVVLAESGRSVALVDLDLREGELAELLGAEQEPGLSDLLAGRTELAGVVKPTAYAGLRLLPSGTPTDATHPLITSAGMNLVLKDLATTVDVVVISAPAALEYADALTVSKEVDTAVLVVPSGVSRKRDLADAYAQLHEGSLDVVGVLLTSVPRRGADADWR